MPKIPKSTISLRHLKCFKELSNIKNFTMVAFALNTSQSSISLAIKELEKALGVSLFIRTTHHVELTKEGNLIKNHIDCIINGHENRISELYKTVKYRTQTIRIACTPTGIQHISSKLLDWVRASPLIDFHIQDMDDHEIPTAVDAHMVDLGVSSNRNITKNLRALYIAQEEIIALIPVQHRLSSQKSIELEDFAAEKISILKRDNYNSYIEQHFTNKNVPIAQFLESVEIETILSLVESGYMLGLIFGSQNNLPPNKYFVARRINQSPITRKLYFIYKNYENQALARFIN